MSLFEFLVLGHLVGDFMLQTNWMAREKAINWLARLAHSTVYTVTVCFFAWVFSTGLSLVAVGLIAISHFLIDKRIVVPWWVAKVMKTGEPDSKWLEIVIDQIVHILFIAVAVYLS